MLKTRVITAIILLVALLGILFGGYYPLFAAAIVLFLVAAVWETFQLFGSSKKQAFAIALFWGVAVATYRGGHICVDAVWERLSARGRRRMDLAATAITLAVLVPLVWMIWSKVGAVGTQTTSDLRLPLVWFYAVGAVGVTMAAVLCVRRLQELARGS